MPAIRILQKSEILDPVWISLFDDLRRLRNDAAHSAEFSPSQEAVMKYIQLANDLIAAMKKASVD